MADEEARRFMAAAVRLGASALGTTWPNPAVGAILVKDGRVIARGRTARGGRPHAEAIALARAGAEAQGSTLHVSLEPCSHHGRTPPCTAAILKAGVRRLIAAAADPDPRVAGRGFERLRAAGVETSTGYLAEKAGVAQAGHFTRTAKGRPYVLLKLAVSADDAIGRSGEGNVAVTDRIARLHVQALRSRFDAILVGRGTVETDDPELTCRLPGLEDRSPVRIVLDSDGRLRPDRNVFRPAAPTWVLTGAGLDEDVGRVRRLRVPRAAGGGLDLAAALVRLGSEGVTRLLVEGGARTARSLLETDLVDEVMLFRSPAALGAGAVAALAGLPLAFIEASGRFRRVERRIFGADRMSRYRRAR